MVTYSVCNTCWNSYNTELKDNTEVCPACRHKLSKYGTIDIKSTGRIYSFVCNECGGQYYSAKEGVVCDTCDTLLHLAAKKADKKGHTDIETGADIETGDRVIVVKAKQYVCNKCGSQYKTWYKSKLGLCGNCRVERNRQQARDRYYGDKQYRSRQKEKYYHSQQHQDAKVARRERIERNEDIYHQRIAGVAANLLAEQYCISVRTVYRINAEMKKHYKKGGER